MKFIVHRINKVNDLKKIPKTYGCEIDLRTKGSDIILNHEPYSYGDNFTDYLDEYNHDTLILNIKESGIENDVISEVKKRGIKNFFLLDVEFPYLFKATNNGERNIAVRFSESEPIENIKLFEKKVDWVWIDTISTLPINHKNIELIKNFKTCLVCPSRWGRKNQINDYKKQLNTMNFNLDYVMTELNNISLWC